MTWPACCSGTASGSTRSGMCFPATASRGWPLTPRRLARLELPGGSSSARDPELASMSAGQRLRGALAELGTTWIKLGQMLSLRPDLVGPDVAAELAQLQADVPADPPGSAEQTIRTDLGRDVSEAFSSFEAAPMASASVAQAHRATLPDDTAVVVKVIHSVPVLGCSTIWR
jgi:predicted unusual protein kinase regulating ubiquinone biosynthesis (AarF/ABC1/UbiB family)